MSAFWKNFAAIMVPAALTFGAAWAQGLNVRQGTGAAIAAIATTLAALHTPAPNYTSAPPSATDPTGVK